MKDQALALALRFDDPQRRLNALREYLQAFIMRSLHESEAGRAVAFVGGTALRFLEDLPRFSEDLDFSRVSADGYEPVRWLEKLKRDLHFAGFDSTVRWIEREPVQVAWVRTAHLLAEAGLSGHARQNLSVKVEIDTRPPAGAAIRRTLVTRHFTFVISHYDLPSLMAGKLHALLIRGYPKGRDWYDLIWYRSRRPPVEPKRPVPAERARPDAGRGPLPGGRLAHPAGRAPCRPGHARTDPRRAALPGAARGRRPA